MNDIKNWIASEDKQYTEGVAIHRKYGRDKDLSAYFDRNPVAIAGSMPFNMLVRELSRLARIAAQTAGTDPELQATHPSLRGSTPKQSGEQLSTLNSQLSTPKLRIVDTLDIDYEKLPPALQAKYKEIQATFKDMCRLHDGLKNLKTDAERAIDVAKLKDMEDSNAERWADIYEWADGNNAVRELSPERKADPELQGMLAERRRRNLGIYINRALKSISSDADLTKEQTEKLQEKVKAWQAELDKLSA